MKQSINYSWVEFKVKEDVERFLNLADNRIMEHTTKDPEGIRQDDTTVYFTMIEYLMHGESLRQIARDLKSSSFIIGGVAK